MIDFIVDFFTAGFQWMQVLVIGVLFIPIYILVGMLVIGCKPFRMFAIWYVDRHPVKKIEKDKLFGTNSVQNAIEMPIYLSQFEMCLAHLERKKGEWGEPDYEQFRKYELREMAELFEHIHELGLRVYLRGVESTDDSGVKFKYKNTRYPYRSINIFSKKREKELFLKENNELEDEEFSMF